MADKTVQINSFKYGLDTRREALASLPGTLQTAENLVIDSGGEIDKRLAFKPVDSAHITLPAGCFGLQDTDTGLMTFGSATTPAGLPTGVVYQQLAYPVTPAPGSMAAVLYSCCFLGKAFVLATFDNENAVFAYYNGTLVAQITDGIVKPSPGGGGVPETPTNLASDLAVIVNRITGWLADANVNAIVPSDTMGYHEVAAAGSVLVMSPPGVHFIPTVTNNNSVSGLLGARLVDQNYAGIAAIGASVAFTLNVGTTGTVTVTAPAKADGSGTAALSGGAVNFHTNLTQTAADVATAINNNTSITGYIAISSVTTVTVFAPPSFGNVTFNLTVVTTGDITTTTGSPGSHFVFYVNPPVVNSSNAKVGLGISYAFLTASYSGNGGVVSFAWQMCNSDGTTVNVQDVGIRVQATGATVGVALQYPHAAGASGYVLCTATDAGPPVVALTKVISVTLPPPAAPPT